jgi:hypothetical protein
MRIRRWGGALVVALGLGFWGAQDLVAQDEVDRVEADQGDKIRVFFDCNAPGCFDLDFLRREITWVDWMRDREDADVHVLVTFQRSGGGFSYFLALIGRREFEGQDNSLTAFSSSTDTEDERRQALADKAKLGLAPYAAETSAAPLLSVTYQDPAQLAGLAPAQASPEEDPWNLWVFTTRLGGSVSGESTFRNLNGNTAISAERISDAWKLQSSASFSYSEQKFDLPSGESSVSFRRSMGGNLLLVKSLGPRWGFGGSANVTSSTRLNYDMRVSVVPAIEFNVFPYEESSRRLFTFQYRVGPEYVRYDERTVFDKTEEWLYRNSLTASLAAQQPWGGASISLSGDAFLDDWKKNSLSAFGNVNLRIVRGLSLNIFASASRVRNRINEPGSEATDLDVFLRNRILGTTITYFANFSISYRFGSIFNNIVNPRFGGGSGRFF